MLGRYGLNHITYLVENQKAGLVAIASDVDPIEVRTHGMHAVICELTSPPPPPPPLSPSADNSLMACLPPQKRVHKQDTLGPSTPSCR